MDELQIDIGPLLLGEGLRLSERLDAEWVELERIGVTESLTTTGARFRDIE